MMIKLTKHADAFWSGNGFGNDKAEWVVKGAEYLHVWAGNAGSWNVTNRETGERVLRNLPKRAIPTLATIAFIIALFTASLFCYSHAEAGVPDDITPIPTECCA